MNNIYKIYQIMEYLSINHDFQVIYLRGNKKDEIWMVNEKHPKYQIIRITDTNIETLDYDQNRINQILNALNNRFLKNLNFLDIHIGKYEVLNEKHDTVSIDENYISGNNIEDVFNGIKEVIHSVEDENKEIHRAVSSINAHSSNLNKNRRNNMLFKTSKVTTIIIAICVINFFLALLLSRKYGFTNSLILLGADYKTFTLGLKQFYRLLTVAFNHGSISHLLMNMMSLSVLGTYIENKYGTKYYLLILFLSVLSGSLTSGILNKNIICVGISGGLYGLSIIYFIDIIKRKAFNPNSLFMILFINIMMNFMSSVSWQAHLGGAICGLVMYMIKESKLKKESIALLVILFLLLGYKYFTIKTITPLFKGSDKELIDMYKDIGFNNYSINLNKRLIEVYDKYE